MIIWNHKMNLKTVFITIAIVCACAFGVSPAALPATPVAEALTGVNVATALPGSGADPTPTLPASGEGAVRASVPASREDATLSPLASGGRAESGVVSTFVVHG